MKERARGFRREMTSAESKMWYFLRNRRFHDYKFVREYVIGSYIVDFACRQKKIIIELDGGQHAEAETVEYDNRRTKFLESQGYKVLRVWNHEIFTNIDGVFEALLDLLESVPG